MVSNTIIQPAALFLKVETAISELQVPELTDQIKNFHQLTCQQARNVVAAYILDSSIKYCTNASEMQLSNASLLICQYNYDDTDVQIQFEDKRVHFFLKNKLTFKPGEVRTLHLHFLSNTQVVADISSDLDENLALAPKLQFTPQLCIREVNIANCLDDIFESEWDLF